MACSDAARLTVERIPLADIRQGDDRFEVTLPQGTERLEASITRIGLLRSGKLKIFWRSRTLLSDWIWSRSRSSYSRSIA